MENEKIEVLLTQEGLESLQEELENLITNTRAEVIEKIKIARSFGDLSENSEYDEAKDEQAKVEARISELESQIKNAKIIDESNKSKSGPISIGDKVLIIDMARKKEMELKIVGTVEADITKQKISNESPLGKALLGKNIGDIVTVKTKTNTIQYKIEEIL